MKPVISIIMGSKSDWATMQKTAEVLDNFGVAYEKKVVSEHHTPDLMFKHAEESRSRSIKVIIAGAGGAAHLPGTVATKTTLPVICVPVKSRALSGVNSLYSIVQMPGATVAIGEVGATNARRSLCPPSPFSRGPGYRNRIIRFCRRTRKNRRGVDK